MEHNEEILTLEHAWVTHRMYIYTAAHSSNHSVQTDWLTWRNLTHCGGVPAIPLVTVRTLDENSAVTQTLSKHLTTDVIQTHASAWGKVMKFKSKNRFGSFHNFHNLEFQYFLYIFYKCELNVPMCLRVSSTAALRLTLDSRPRQKRSALEGSVKPSTVRDGCEAWKVSPTRWFSS